MVLQTNNVCQKQIYPLEYTDGIIPSMIGSDIWSNFIPTLCKILAE
jgi:hypothetical protein